MFSFGWNESREEKKLPAPKLIGRTAHKSLKMIWDLVMDGQSRIIGVHGMTGVGKTAITRNVYQQVLDTRGQFDQVIWLDNSQVIRDNEEIRNMLIYKKRVLLFMEDVEYTDKIIEHYTEEISNEMLHFIITNIKTGNKLVFTTKSVDVCTRMGCKEDCIVQVELLSEMEALELFWETVGREVDPTPRMTDIAKEVVKECARLPLSVLFLNKNPNLCTISHHFFVHMTDLKILDLRDNLKLETLPDSISDVIDLRVLRLSRCRSLKQVPSLAKLLHMQMLELDETAIEELPHGIELLVELKVLKLHSLRLREAISNDYLSMLHSLPHLQLHL